MDIFWDALWIENNTGNNGCMLKEPCKYCGFLFAFVFSESCLLLRFEVALGSRFFRFGWSLGSFLWFVGGPEDHSSLTCLLEGDVYSRRLTRVGSCVPKRSIEKERIWTLEATIKLEGDSIEIDNWRATAKANTSRFEKLNVPKGTVCRYKVHFKTLIGIAYGSTPWPLSINLYL